MIIISCSWNHIAMERTTVSTFLFISILHYFCLTNASNWCEIESIFCKTANGGTLQHIGCNNNNNTEKSKCPQTELIKIDEELKDKILEYHNIKRTGISSGEYETFEPASRMAQMIWDNDLQTLGEMQVKTCSLENDKCLATVKHPKPGQIIGRFKNDRGKDVDELVNDILDDWFIKGSKYFTDNKNIEFFNIKNDEAIKFATMIHENNSVIGCGLMKYLDGSSAYVLTCNYAESIEMGKPLYEIGEPCTECFYGCSPEFPNLCFSYSTTLTKKRFILDWDARPELQNLVLEQHNEKRMEISTGKLRNFKPASQMYELIWDKELQNLAQAYVLSPSSNENNKNIGQNIYWITQNDFGIMANLKQTMSAILTKIINKWWEDGLSSMSPYLVDYYNSEDEVTSRFANMIYDNATRIGCGLVKHVIAMKNSMEIIFACNYEPRFNMKKSLYKVGASCSECSYGCSNRYAYLCYTNETNDS